MTPNNFFAELKRRNIYRAGLAYAAAAWLLIQIITQVAPYFEVPAFAVRTMIFLLIGGFPFALVFAWIFALTHKGVRRIEDVPPNESIPQKTGCKIDVVIIAMLLLGVAMWLFDRPRTPQPTEFSVLDTSIAVLPFENMSKEKENAFLADGIQDDILSSLAKIQGLKVINRTSVMEYRDASARNLRDIAKTLGVAHILEGSVRRSANRVEVSVQLIDVSNDHHRLVESYNRTIFNALTLQGELASEIASALRANLSPEEKARVERKHTDNPVAYISYLRARQFEIPPDAALEDLKAAVQLYEKATKLDPNFALAHARLAATIARIYHSYEQTDAWKRQAHAEAQESLRLAPNLGEGHFALGLCFFWLERNYPRALQELTAAQALVPSDIEIGLNIAAIARQQGRWEDALATLQRIEAIDPQNPNIIRNLIYTFGALRMWPEGVRAAERFDALAPTVIRTRIKGAYMTFFWKGSTAALETFLSTIPPGIDPDGVVTAARWDLCMIKRDFARAKQILDASPLSEISYLNGGLTPKSFLTGCTAVALGDPVLAKTNLEVARKVFEDAVVAAPNVAERHANLGLCYAFMGAKVDAIREGRRAVELKPETKDAYDGAIMNCCLALIYARTGENALAISLIERLLHTPGAVDSVNYSITVNDLKYRWEWDLLRSDPRFQKLVSQN